MDHQGETGGVADLARPFQAFFTVLTDQVRRHSDFDADNVVSMFLAHPYGTVHVGEPEIGEFADIGQITFPERTRAEMP